MILTEFIANFRDVFPWIGVDTCAWQVTAECTAHVQRLIASLASDYRVDGDIAIHQSARIEAGAVLKPPVVIGPECVVASHAYLRGGVFLEHAVTVGPSTEVKSSFVFSETTLAHLNFIGDSLIGARANIEAGAVFANHFNEREEKSIRALLNGRIVNTGTTKFGAMVGDGVRVGANAVLSPGTILRPGEVVNRLRLVDQIGNRPAPE